MHNLLLVLSFSILLISPVSLFEIIYASLGEDLLYSCPRTAPIKWSINGNSLTTNSSSYTTFPSGSLLVTPVTQSIVGITVSNQCCPESTSDCHSFFFILSSIEYPVQDNVTGLEFSEASLECNAPSTQPPPSFAWFRDSELVSNDRVYILRNVSRGASGPYTCTITNSIGNRSTDMYLTVEYPPSVVIPGPGTLSFSVGEEITLECLVTGVPEPQMEWHFNEDTADISDASRITANSADLTILAVSYNQSGYYSCFAINSRGTSQSSVHVTIQAKPQPPEVSIAGTTSSSITIEWVYGDNGNSPLTRTYIEHMTGTSSVWENKLISGNLTTGSTITGLVANTEYTIRVSVYNALGQSGYAAVQASTRPIQPPTPLQVRLLVLSPSSLRLLWLPPLLTREHTPVLGYEYQIRPVGASAWSPLANCPSSQLIVEFQSLTPGTLYEARVRSINSAGPGTFITAQNMTNFTYPGQPGLSAAALDFRSIRASWSASTTGGTPLLFWSLEISEDSLHWALVSTFDITQTQYDVTNELRPNTTYFLRVWVNNELGSSPVSQVMVATHVKRPIGAVDSNISAVFITASSIKIFWLPVEYTDIASALDYGIKYSLLAHSIAPTHLVATEQTHYTFQNLEPLSTYKFSIVARDGPETSTHSVVFYFTTALPSLRIVPRPPSPAVGHKFKLSCVFTEKLRGLFSPSYVSWYRGGASLRELSQNQSADFYLHKNHLVFPKFAPSHYGNYSCRVRDRFARKLLERESPVVEGDFFSQNLEIILISAAIVGCFLAFLCLMCVVLCCIVCYRRNVKARNARYPVGIPKRSWFNQGPYSPLRGETAGFNPLKTEVDTHSHPRDSSQEPDRLFEHDPTGEAVYTTSFLHNLSSAGHTPNDTADRPPLLRPGLARDNFDRLEAESSPSSRVDSDVQAPPLPPPFSTEEAFGDSLSLPKRLTITEGMSGFRDRETFESPPSSVRTAPNYDVISNDSAPTPLYQNIRPQTDSHVHAVELITLPDNCISTDI